MVVYTAVRSLRCGIVSCSMVARPSPRSLLEHGSDYNVASALSNRDRHALIEKLSVEANIIYKQLEHGISILQASVRLNQFRELLVCTPLCLQKSGFKVA
jgi:hypothetical protein